MKNANICPRSRFASVERYRGRNRRDTRRVRTKIYNYCESRFRDQYLPNGLCNSWIVNGHTITPMWVRPVPNTYYGVEYFVLLVHDGTHLLGWWRCFEHNDFYGTRNIATLPNGKKVFVEWHKRGLNDLIACANFYRPYEEPTKDLEDFDIWRDSRCPSAIAASIVNQARVEWAHYRGTARLAYEIAHHNDIMVAIARREANAVAVKRGRNSANFNRRQLRALGFIA